MNDESKLIAKWASKHIKWNPNIMKSDLNLQEITVEDCDGDYDDSNEGTISRSYELILEVYSCLLAKFILTREIGSRGRP